MNSTSINLIRRSLITYYNKPHTMTCFFAVPPYPELSNEPDEAGPVAGAAGGKYESLSVLVTR